MVIVPSWAFRAVPVARPRGRQQVRLPHQAQRPDLREVRTPCQRSRAHTFRCPSPRKGDAARTARIASRSVSSLHRGLDARRRGGRGGVACRAWVAYTVDRATSHMWHMRARPYGRCTEGKTVWLMLSTFVGQGEAGLQAMAPLA